MPNGIHNATNSDFVISVRGKQFILSMDAELVVGIGDQQFMLSLDYAAQTVYVTDPKTGEKMNLQVNDVLVDGVSISDKLDIIDRIQNIVDVSQTGLVLVDDDTQVTGMNDTLLNRNTFQGNNSYEIDGLEEGTVIYQIELDVQSAFHTNPDTQHNIAVYGEDGSTVIFDANWNDPNTQGVYSTLTHYVVGAGGKVIVKHSLSAMTDGIANLKLYCYKPAKAE